MAMRGFQTEEFSMSGGFRQGSPESSYLFSLIIAHILQKLVADWKTRGLGVNLGNLGGDRFARLFFETNFDAHLDDNWNIDDIHIAALGFVDDLYLFASVWKHSQIMLNELLTELGKIGP